jgi:2-polyprenyl-3-methyl-5-hydroxy-6-metoxy-1,4-benzoquinol methylase
MKQLIRTLVEKCANVDGESRKVIQFVLASARLSGARVLDVGCGYGRFLRPLIASGLEVTGVDTNPMIVAANRKANLPCMTPEEFAAAHQTYDVILMAHVIERFTPSDLFVFFDDISIT